MIHQRDWFQQILVGVTLFGLYLGYEEWDLTYGSAGVEKKRLDLYMQERAVRLHSSEQSEKHH